MREKKKKKKEEEEGEEEKEGHLNLTLPRTLVC